MNTFAKLMVSAAALVVVVVAGINLLPARDGGPGTTATASPSPTPAPTATLPVTPSPVTGAEFPPSGDLAIGDHIVSANQHEFIVKLEATGWVSGGMDPSGRGGYFVKGATGAEQAWIIFWSPDSVFADPCAHTIGPAVGPTAVDLANAIATIPGTDATEPANVIVNGLPTKYLEITVRADVGCKPGEFYLWSEDHDGRQFGPRFASSIPTTIRAWIVQLDEHLQSMGKPGQRVFIESELLNGAGLEVDQEIQKIIDSIAFFG